jgi:hypothetical protein
MTMPTIPDIDPLISLTRTEVIHMIIASIAMEEMGLSHILNAQSEKMQRFIVDKNIGLNDILKLNDSTERVLRGVINSQILLQFKLQDILQLEKQQKPEECEKESEEEDFEDEDNEE